MTFTQLISSIDDANNSCNVTNYSSFQGVATSTVGYSNIIITIKNSIEGELKVYLSDNSSINDATDLVYSDTIFSNVPFTKSYAITKNYYYIKYTCLSISDFTITSRLSTNDLQTNSVQVFDSNVEAARDAFGKMRISSPQTLLDIRFPGQSSGNNDFLTNNLQLSFNITGSGSYNGTYHSTNSACTLNISGIGSVISQSRNYCVYQPGKSLLIMMSGIIGFNSTASNGCNGSVGYFDNNNGAFFNCQMVNYQNVPSVNLRNAGTDSIIIQSSWNIDKMDGTGSSHLNLDFTKAQLFVIDMEWLGVGRVRYGFYAYGTIHYCHQITNINMLSFTPYTQNNNLPIRYQVSSTSSTNYAYITQICSTVISEGGYNPIGRPFVMNTPSLTVTQSELPFLAIRGGGVNYNHQIILPTSLSIVNTGSNDITNYRLRLYRDGTATFAGLAGWSNVDTQSVTQYTTSFTGFSVNGSIVVDEDFVVGRSGTSYQDLSNIFSSLLQITANAQNVSDVLVLTLVSLAGSNATSYAKLGWSEIY